MVGLEEADGDDGGERGWGKGRGRWSKKPAYRYGADRVGGCLDPRMWKGTRTYIEVDYSGLPSVEEVGMRR